MCVNAYSCQVCVVASDILCKTVSAEVKWGSCIDSIFSKCWAFIIGVVIKRYYSVCVHLFPQHVNARKQTYAAYLW